MSVSNFALVLFLQSAVLVLAIVSYPPNTQAEVHASDTQDDADLWETWERAKSCNNMRRPIKTHVCPLLSEKGEGAIANLIIASGPKSGSTGIWRDLLKHGMVSYGLACKEMKFFSYPQFFHGNKTADWNESIYRRYFAPPCPYADLVYTDGSPIYWRSVDAARRIALHLPKAKVLVIVRDPMKRFISRLVGNYEHQPRWDWLTCKQHTDGFRKRQQQCATSWHEGCHWDDFGGQDGEWVPLRTAIGETMSAVILQGIWGQFFNLTGSDGRFLTLPLDFVSNQFNYKHRWMVYQYIAQFLGIRPWQKSELERIGTKELNDYHGSSHNEHYEDARQHPEGSWGRLYAEKAGPSWDCSEEDIATLHRLFEPDNERLRRVINGHVMRREMKVKLALPRWLTKKYAQNVGSK